MNLTAKSLASLGYGGTFRTAENNALARPPPFGRPGRPPVRNRQNRQPYHARKREPGHAKETRHELYHAWKLADSQ